ncbi:helix-turn-helix domain-containing protein [Elizabethkingia sp. M8]|uniref:helix-turn-helix domain-containing protein n=1 Tax=Elizabethkingia sp. M8 TaxID=2796140 RepID=UPI001903D49D|nr:helix-turn-helix domain-containing protein [Elizabethkingia sp. M8]QQM28086.1 helix-turn-helix domain-containing protein [Elizabethkingia sp. M8]
MHNFVLSPIDPKILIDSIAEKVTANILNAVKKEQQPTEPKDELLTIQEASELLRLSVPTLYSKVSKRELPYMKRGKRLYFSHSELLDYIKEGKRKTSAEIKAEALNSLSNKKRLNNGK